MAKPIEMKEMRPQFGKFTLEATGEIEHTFRKITIDDEQWVIETLGAPLDQLFAEGAQIRLSDLCRIYHHQLLDPHQFKPEKERGFCDETAEEIVRVVPAHRVFMRSISGPEEFKKVADAFLKTVVGSRGTMSEAEKKTSKKKDGRSAGDKSSISSATSTESSQTT